MMLFFMFTLLLTEASNWHQHYDSALISKVYSALSECSAAYGVFQDFVSESSLDTDRRRNEDQFAEVDGILKTCGAILDAAAIFREDPHAFGGNGRVFGNIILRSSELTFLNAILGDKSKEIGDTLYVASRDGDAASDFHSACDDQGPTVVIVQTESGDVFGGYAGISWAGPNWTRVDEISTDSFLFKLRPKMKSYLIQNELYALSHYAYGGPAFYKEFYIKSEALSGGNSSVVANVKNYAASDGSYFSDGLVPFKVTDYAVLKAI